MHLDENEEFQPSKERAYYHAFRISLRLGIALLSTISFAQVDRSGLNGTISDSSGLQLPQTHITVMQNTTGLRRDTVSDASGNYSVLELPVGVYTVTFEHEGFRKVEFVNVEETIGKTRTLNATLRAAGGEEQVEVSSASALLDHNTSAITGLIEKAQADELALNGRNWAGLTAFVPGAVDTGGSNQRTIRFAGRGLDDSNFTYDGIDATNIVNQTQRQWVRLSIPLDSIQEFRVNSLMSTAEDGATGGAQLDVSSPSGTNRFRGRLFEYLRNDSFDAPLPLWASNGESQQPLRLNQFGGSLGGPIVRDKTFFFLASEAYRQNWGYPVIGNVPSEALVASVPSNSPVSAIMKGFPHAGPNAIVTPTDDPNIDLLTCACTQVVNENSYMLRLDQHFTAKTAAFMRFNYDRSVNTQPLSASATDPQQKVSNPINGALGFLHIFNPNLLNEAHAGFNRSTSNQYNYSGSGILYQIVVSGGSPGFVEQNYDYISLYVGNSYSANDTTTWVRGRNTVKAGVEFRYIQMNQEYSEHGKLTFSSIENLAGDVLKKASLTGSLPVNGLRKEWYFVFGQDEFKWRPNLTLNLGLRYSVFGLFDEAHGLANPFDFDTCGRQGFCGLGAHFGTQNYGDVDPRVAFAWTPYRGGKTVIRGGFGIYHEDGQLDDQNLPAKNEVPSYAANSSSKNPLTYTGSIPGNCPGPVVVSTSGNCGFGAGSLSPNAEQRNRKDSYVEQWSLSLQQEMAANFVGTMSYLGSRGVHLLETNVVNLYQAPAYTTLEYPAFSPAIGWRGSVGMSTYNGLSAGLRRPFSSGLLVAANYTWSHEIDNGSNGSGDGDNIDPQNPLCQRCDTASGAWDATHVVNGNAVYELPFGQGKPMLNQHGVVSMIAGNWQLTTSALARTGFPVNILMPSSYTAASGASGTQRPDLVPGVSLTPPGGKSVAQWINPAAFAYPGTFSTSGYGSTPRNAVRGPGTWQVDMSAEKTFILTERMHLQFRSEFYNIFNHPQLGQPNATCNTAGRTQAGCGAGFAGINTTVNLNVAPVTPIGSGTPREMQFALRLDF